MMTINSAAAERGAAWLTEGFGYFTRGAGAWLVMTVIFIIFMALASALPMANLLFIFLSPLLIGGMLLACHEQDNGAAATVGHLFAGFSRNTGQLVLLGLFHFIGLLLITAVTVVATLLSVGMAAIHNLFSQLTNVMHTGDIYASVDAAQALLLPLLLLLLYFAFFYVPLIMALWFSPALVMLKHQNAVDAMVNSFKGCAANIVPFLVYGVVGLVLSIIASIPMMLGWLILFPVIVASVYLGYKDIFSEEVEPAADA